MNPQAARERAAAYTPVLRPKKVMVVGGGLEGCETALYHGLEFEIPEICLLGNAKKVSNIMYAVWDAFEVANHI